MKKRKVILMKLQTAMLTSNCYFLGFMGAGKSHVCQLLGKEHQLPVVDLDQLIEKQEGQSIAAIFEQKGEAYFREVEQKALHSTLELPPSLVALGGGTPIYNNNMDWIKAHGKSVFLDPPLSTLLKRLEGERAHRPLLANLSTQELEKSVQTRLEARRPIYEKADLCIHSNSTFLTLKFCSDYLKL